MRIKKDKLLIICGLTIFLIYQYIYLLDFVVRKFVCLVVYLLLVAGG